MNEHRRLKKMRYGLCIEGCDWIEDYLMTKHNCLVKTKTEFGMWEYLPMYVYKNIRYEDQTRKTL